MLFRSTVNALFSRKKIPGFPLWQQGRSLKNMTGFPIATRLAPRDPGAIRLYSWPTPNGQKVSIALEEMGRADDAHLVDFATDDQMSPAFLSLNPNTKIPAILDPMGPGGRPLALAVKASGARGGGAAQAIVDGTAQAGFRDRGDCDLAIWASKAVCLAQDMEQIGRSLDQIAGGGQGERGGAETQIDFIWVWQVRVEAQGRHWRIMRGELSGRAGCVGIPARWQAVTKHRLQRLNRDAPGAQQSGCADEAENGRFHANRTEAAIKHGRDAALEALHHMIRAGRRDAAGGVGGRCCEGAAEGTQQGLCCGVRGHPDGDGCKVCGDERRQVCAGFDGQDQRQGAGPEGGGDIQRGIMENSNLAGGVEVGDMHDQRVETRAAFRREDAGCGHVRAGIAAKAVDGFSWKSDQLIAAQNFGSARKACRGGRKGFGLIHHVTQRWP